MTEIERIIASAAVAGVALSPERAQAASPLVRAMEYADRALAVLELTQPPSGPDAAPGPGAA